MGHDTSRFHARASPGRLLPQCWSRPLPGRESTSAAGLLLKVAGCAPSLPGPIVSGTLTTKTSSRRPPIRAARRAHRRRTLSLGCHLHRPNLTCGPIFGRPVPTCLRACGRANPAIEVIPSDAIPDRPRVSSSSGPRRGRRAWRRRRSAAATAHRRHQQLPLRRQPAEPARRLQRRAGGVRTGEHRSPWLWAAARPQNNAGKPRPSGVPRLPACRGAKRKPRRAKQIGPPVAQ
jgi:hypothetical protein